MNNTSFLSTNCPESSSESLVDDHAEVSRLFTSMAQGNRVAFDELYSRYRNLVYAVSLQILHNHEDAEDTTQEIFSQLWQRSSQYSDQKGRLSSWLTTLTKNRSIDKIRSRDRRSRLNQGFADETVMEKCWRAPAPHEVANMNEMGSQARVAVQQLSEEQREAILLAYFEGLTQQEISSRIRTPLGTVKARIRRGLTRMKSLIHE